MAIQRVSTILDKARQGNYAVMCFECVNYEQIAWCIAAAEEQKSDIIIMLYYDMDFYTPVPLFLSMAKALAQEAKVQVGLTYVYADDYERVKAALEAGFPSVCYNPKAVQPDERIQETQRIVRLADHYGADVSANPGEMEMTDASYAIRFGKETGIAAMIAPVVYGDKNNNLNFTPLRHWYDTNIDYIDFGRLDEIHKGLPIPLIIHRSYNLSTQQLVSSLEYGVAQIDNGCPFDTAMYHGFKQVMDTEDCGDSYFALLMNAREKVMAYVASCIKSVH